jgi:hypothetical protein
MNEVGALQGASSYRWRFLARFGMRVSGWSRSRFLRAMLAQVLAAVLPYPKV